MERCSSVSGQGVQSALTRLIGSHRGTACVFLCVFFFIQFKVFLEYN